MSGARSRPRWFAGSLGTERHRTAQMILEDLARIAAGSPPLQPVDPSRRAITA